MKSNEIKLTSNQIKSN